MEEMCRLCCSTTFVNNNIFDDENALYIKMSLYLPIKVFKNDSLPQKICDKCSCKVNDIYQFCNETIEVQNRLRKALSCNRFVDDTFDLTRVKHNMSPPPLLRCEQSTQTESGKTEPAHILADTPLVQVKVEPGPETPPMKLEDSYIDDDRSSDSDTTLMHLKIKKQYPKQNGKVPKKRGRKKKKVDNMEEWKLLMKALPEATLNVVDKIDLPLDVKEEIDDEDMEAADKLSELADNELYHCCVCSTQVYGKSNMMQHYRGHADKSSMDVPPPPPPPGQDPTRCSRCRKLVARREWGPHWARHCARDARPYSCSRCEKTFRLPKDILKHGTTHDYSENAGVEQMEKRFVCDLCPEAFVYMRYLLAHRSRAHPDAGVMSLRCAVCGRGFAHSNSLSRHLRAHSGERNFLCNVCGKALSSREHLKFHIRIHTGYKPNVCKTCGKGFVKKCNLTLHERVHSGEKPHVCSHCGKAFSQRSTLVIHERYHSGARPYVCSLCGRGFVARGLLSMHLKTTCI